MIRAIFFLIACCVVAVPASAQQLTPAELQAYVDMLKRDREAYQDQLDILRLKMQQLLIAEAQREKALDDYWRRYTGLDKKR